MYVYTTFRMMEQKQIKKAHVEASNKSLSPLQEKLEAKKKGKTIAIVWHQDLITCSVPLMCFYFVRFALMESRVASVRNYHEYGLQQQCITYPKVALYSKINVAITISELVLESITAVVMCCRRQWGAPWDFPPGSKHANSPSAKCLP